MSNVASPIRSEIFTLLSPLTSATLSWSSLSSTSEATYCASWNRSEIFTLPSRCTSPVFISPETVVTDFEVVG